MNSNKTCLAIALAALLSACGSDSGGSSGSVTTYSGSGQVGSLAALVEFQQDLHAVDAVSSVAVLRSNQPLTTDFVGRYGGSVETIHVYQDSHVLLGTPNGVDIYLEAEVDGDPLRWIAWISHITANDPVIAHQGLAYYTTRDGNEQELTIRDGVFVEDINEIVAYVPPTDAEIEQGAVFESPASTAIAEYRELAEPLGLSYREGVLYVCDQAEGLVALSLEENSDEAAEFSHHLVRQPLNDAFSCKDVLSTEQGLILVGSDGVYQLASDAGNLSIISHIPSS